MHYHARAPKCILVEITISVLSFFVVERMFLSMLTVSGEARVKRTNGISLPLTLLCNLFRLLQTIPTAVLLHNVHTGIDQTTLFRDGETGNVGSEARTYPSGVKSSCSLFVDS